MRAIDEPTVLVYITEKKARNNRQNSASRYFNSEVYKCGDLTTLKPTDVNLNTDFYMLSNGGFNKSSKHFTSAYC